MPVWIKPKWFRWMASDTGWLLSFCLARIAFMLPFDTYAATQSLLMADWGLSASQAGLIHSSFYIGYLLSLFGVGVLADRYGAKRVMLISNAAAAVSAFLFAVFADDFRSGLLLYGISALFAGGSYTPALTLIAQRIDSSRRGWAFGWYIAATTLGYAASLYLSSKMMSIGGWRSAFYVTACGPVLGTILVGWIVRHTANIVASSIQGESPNTARSAVLTNKSALLAILGYTAHSWELLGMRAWMPTFLAAAVAFNTSESVRAASIGASFSALMTAASMLGNILAGALPDRWGRTAVAIGIGAISVGCSFSIGWCLAMPLWFTVTLGVLYSTAAFGDSSIYSTAITELVPASHQGTAYALRSVLGFGTGVVSPAVFGLVLDQFGHGIDTTRIYVWGAAFAVLGVGGLLAPLGTLWLRHLPESRQMAGGLR